MGNQKVHPVVAVTVVFVENKEDDVRIAAASTQIQNQEQAAYSGVQLSEIEQLLDKLIWAYSNLCNRHYGIEDVNQGLEGMVKLMDVCSRIQDKIVQDVAAYAALLTSAIKISCSSASPTTVATSSKALASAATFQVGCCTNLRLDCGFSADASSLTLEGLVQQSHQLLESLAKCLTVTVYNQKKSKSLRRTIERVMKKKSSKESCGIVELKTAEALVRKMSAEEKEERKMALASDIKKASQNLENGISGLQKKISLLRASLVQTRVAFLDFLTYSS